MTEAPISDRQRRGYRIARNVVSRIATGAGWTTMMGSFAATAHWVSLAPQTPDIARGMVVEHDEHGSITYFTAYQNSAQFLMLFGGLAIFALAFLIIPKRDVVHRRGFLSWGMTFKPDDPESVRGWAAVVGVAVGLGLVQLIDPTLAGWAVNLAQRNISS